MQPREEINEDTARKGAAQKNILPCWNLWAPASACVCFMLFDGSGSERLTVCQCHSLSADVSEQGTGVEKKKNTKKNTKYEMKMHAPPCRGGVYILVTSRLNTEKQNVKS